MALREQKRKEKKTDLRQHAPSQQHCSTATTTYLLSMFTFCLFTGRSIPVFLQRQRNIFYICCSAKLSLFSSEAGPGAPPALRHNEKNEKYGRKKKIGIGPFRRNEDKCS